MRVDQSNTIRVGVESRDEMFLLGQNFGSHFLRPAIRYEADDTNNLVISMYSPKALAEREFMAAACSTIPVLAAKVAEKGFAPSTHGPSLDFSISVPKTSEINHLFRAKDFSAHIGEKDCLKIKPGTGLFEPRSSLPPQPGFDLLQDPPLKHLNGSHVVIIVGGQFSPLPRRATTQFKSRVYQSRVMSHQITQDDIRSSEIKNAPAVVIEMGWMRFYSLTQPDLSKTAFDPERRIVSITLTTENAALRSLFASARPYLENPTPF